MPPIPVACKGSLDEWWEMRAKEGQVYASVRRRADSSALSLVAVAAAPPARPARRRTPGRYFDLEEWAVGGADGGEGGGGKNI